MTDKKPRRPREVIRTGTVRVVLHGRLRKEFGPEFHLGVTTPGAAIRALIALKPGFRDSLSQGQYRVRRGKYREGVDLPPPGLILRLPPGGEMHIIPVAKGAKSPLGLGKIILGVVLVAAAFITMQPELLAANGSVLSAGGLGTPLFGGLTSGSLLLAGGAMILSGIISLVSPQPRRYTTEPSYALGGLQNTANQGVPVPIPYGRIRVGSIIGSIGYTAVDYVPTYYGQQTPRPSDYPAYHGGTTPWGTTTIVAGSSDNPTASTGSTTTIPSGTPPSFGLFNKTTGAKNKGGAENVPIHADTLFSNAVVQLIDILGEGPIGGLVNGAQSIYFDGTPLQAEDNSFNFYGVTWEIRLGYPSQEPVRGFPASQSSASVGLQVKQANPVVQRITGVSATAAQVTMQIPAAFSVNPSNGEIKPVQIQYMIESRPSQLASPGFVGSWSTVAQVNLAAAKSSSPYQKSHKFDLDRSNGADTWDIRVTRVTADSNNTTYLQNDTYWLLLDTIVDHQMMYSNTAYIALSIDAHAFGGSTVPTRTYEIYGRTIAVPANYSVAAPGTGGAPGARTYATTGIGTSGGTWDLASYSLLPSDNPAFILFDLLQTHRYGIGLSQSALEAVKSELYVIAQYADQMVPDGFGGTEPRYSVNVLIGTQDAAYNVIQLVASALRGMTYWGSGQVYVTADMPLSVAKLANQTNVLDGTFEYSGTSLKTRPNLVRVAYLDSNNRYLQTVEPVSNAQDIAVRGVIPSDVVGWGITTRGRAHRLGKWIMYTAQKQTETVTYKGGFYHLDTRPGMIVGLSDPAYAGARMAGRLRSATIPVGQNLIANSVAPTFAVTAPNTVTANVTVPGLIAGVAANQHTSESSSIPDCGHIGVSAAAGTYYVSCYVWIVTAVNIASVTLTASSTIDPSLRAVLSSSDGRVLSSEDGSVVTVSTDAPPSNVANLSLLGQWQRLSFVAILGSAGTLTAELAIVSAGTGEAVWSTCWSIDPTGLNPFVSTAGGVPVIQQVLLDTTFIQDGSAVYTISVVLPDGTVDNNVPVTGFMASGAPANPGNLPVGIWGVSEYGQAVYGFDPTLDGAAAPPYTIVQLGRPLRLVPSANAEWIITSTNLSPRQFQVLACGEDHKGSYTVTAVNYDIDKFAIVEEGLNFVSPTYSNLPALLTVALPAPTSITVRDYIKGFGSTQTVVVIVSYTTPLDPRVAGYQIYASSDGGYYKIFASKVGAVEIDELTAGLTYTFGVRSIAAGGQTSVWTTSAPTLIDGKVVVPPAPLGLTALGGTRRVSLNWQPVPNRGDILGYDIYRSSVSTGGPGAGATLLASVSATTYLDADTTNLLPNTTWYYWVCAVADGTPTVPGAFAGPAAGTTTLLVADDLAAAILSTASLAQTIFDVGIITNVGTVGSIVDSLAWSTGSITIAGTLYPSGLYEWDGTEWTAAANPSQGYFNVIASAIASFGGVKADQINADQILAGTLAADIILSSAAQFGSVQIGSANIGTLAVGTSNIAAGAITHTAYAYSGSSFSPGVFTAPTTVGTVTVTVSEYGKVILLISITDTVATYVSAGGGGSEGGAF